MIKIIEEDNTLYKVLMFSGYFVMPFLLFVVLKYELKVFLIITSFNLFLIIYKMLYIKFGKFGLFVDDKGFKLVKRKFFFMKNETFYKWSEVEFKEKDFFYKNNEIVVTSKLNIFIMNINDFQHGSFINSLKKVLPPNHELYLFVTDYAEKHKIKLI